MISTDTAITIVACDPSDRDQQLEEAVGLLRAKAAAAKRQGILVARHDCSSYTVALSDAVPYGLTREHQVR